MIGCVVATKILGASTANSENIQNLPLPNDDATFVA